MTGLLTDDQRAFQQAAQRFAREQIAPGYMTARKRAASTVPWSARWGRSA